MSTFKDAMLRAALVGAAPVTRDELYMVADALRVWEANAHLRNGVVAKLDVDPQPMMKRLAMVIALVKFGVDPAPENMGEEYTPPADDTEDGEESD